MNTAAAFGIGARRPQRIADETQGQALQWGPWHVVPRAHGFHVSRESRDGHGHQTLLNEVRRTKIFRVEENARQAATAANEQQGGAA